MRIYFDWNVERLQLAERLWGDGWSAANIARKLNAGVSRNAVIGMVARRGWKRARSAKEARSWADGIASTTSGQRRTAAAKHPGAYRSAKSILARGVAAMPEKRMGGLRRAKETVSYRRPKSAPRGGIAITRLRDSLCHWPLWPDHGPERYSKDHRKYCGASVAREGLVYCHDHCCAAYPAYAAKHKHGGKSDVATKGLQEPKPRQAAKEAEQRGVAR